MNDIYFIPHDHLTNVVTFIWKTHKTNENREYAHNCLFAFTCQ